MLLKTEGGLQPGHRSQKQSPCSGKIPDRPLLRREVESQTPPPHGEYLQSGSDYGRDKRFRAQTRLGSDRVLSRRQERLNVKISAGLLESRLGLKTGESSEEHEQGMDLEWRKPATMLPGEAMADTNTHTLYSPGPEYR